MEADSDGGGKREKCGKRGKMRDKGGNMRKEGKRWVQKKTEKEAKGGREGKIRKKGEKEGKLTILGYGLCLLKIIEKKIYFL